MNYSKSIINYEQKINMLISNLLIHIFSLYNKNKEQTIDENELTKTEIILIKKLNTLKEEELKSLTKLIFIINTGVLKYLNKYFIIDVPIENNVNIYFRTLSDLSVFRKINKKLNKESKDSEILEDIKKIFDENYITLCSILQEIINTDEGFTSCKDIEQVHEKIQLSVIGLESKILSKFIMRPMISEEIINEQ